MSDLRAMLERVGERVTPPDDALERLDGLRRRKARNRRVQAGVLALLVAAGGTFGVLQAFHHRTGRTSAARQPPADFHALWPEPVLADARHAQDLVDAGQDPWRLDAAQVVARFAADVLDWKDAITDPGGCFGSDCPFDVNAQAFNVHHDCLACPGVVVEVQRLVRPGDTGIWSVTRVAGSSVDLKVEPGATIESGGTVVGPLASPGSGVVFGGYTYIGQCGALGSFAPVNVTGGQLEMLVATSSFKERCGSARSSASGSSFGVGGPGLLAEPVDGYVFVARVSGPDNQFNPFARGPDDTTEIDDLAAVPVLFVPAVGSPSEKPSGVFQWCPDATGSLPPDANAAAEASDVALKFSKAYAAGDTAAARSMADAGAFGHASWSVTGQADAITVKSNASAAGDGLVVQGCGADVAAQSWEVSLDDGTSSASLDFTLYLILRPDGWNVWGSY